ncbi:MAG TPA: histidine phosphatase family protein [Gaiellaceae bacterium]|nr:histidine phosphatase family protein [Gaiellaceae bacterium]
MRIFLVRHAEAAPGEPDDLRPLTAAGKAAARALGEQLATNNIDAVVCSPLLRARETADAIASASNLEAEPDERLAPGADVAGLSNAVADRGHTVVVVGHQPDCSELVLALTGQEVSFAPGSVRELEL